MKTITASCTDINTDLTELVTQLFFALDVRAFGYIFIKYNMLNNMNYDPLIFLFTYFLIVLVGYIFYRIVIFGGS